MGCSIQKMRNCTNSSTINITISPDHSKFSIIRTEVIGKFLIVEL